MPANTQAAPVVYKGDPRVVAKKLEAQADVLAQTLRSLELENVQLKQRLEMAQMTFQMSQLVLNKLLPPADGTPPAGAPGSSNGSSSNSSKSTSVNPAWSACAASLRAVDQYVGSVLGGLPEHSSPSSHPPEPMESIPNLGLTPADVAARSANGATVHFNMDPLRTLAAYLARLDYSQCAGLGDLMAAKQRLQATRKDAALLLMCRLAATTPADIASADAAIVRRLALDGHLNVAMVLLHPMEIYQVQYSNQATGAQAEVPPPEHTQALLSRMQLADWQAAQIAAIWRVYDQVNMPLLRACKDLQNQLASRSSSIPQVLGLQRDGASSSAPPGTPAAPAGQPQQGDSGMAGSGSSSGSGSGGGALRAGPRPSVLRAVAATGGEGQERSGLPASAMPQPHADSALLEQLDNTLRRLAWLNWCFAHLVACTLNAQQVAALFVFSHPYGVGVSVWAGYLAEHYPNVPLPGDMPRCRSPAAHPSQPHPHNGYYHQQKQPHDHRSLAAAAAAAAAAGQGAVGPDIRMASATTFVGGSEGTGSGAWMQQAAVPLALGWQERGGASALPPTVTQGVPAAACAAAPVPAQQQQQQQQYPAACGITPGSGWVPTQWPPPQQQLPPAGAQMLQPQPVLPPPMHPAVAQAPGLQGVAGVAGAPPGGVMSSLQGVLADAGLSELVALLSSPDPVDFSSGAWQQQLDALSDDQVAALLLELDAAMGPDYAPT